MFGFSWYFTIRKHILCLKMSKIRRCSLFHKQVTIKQARTGFKSRLFVIMPVSRCAFLSRYEFVCYLRDNLSITSVHVLRLKCSVGVLIVQSEHTETHLCRSSCMSNRFFTLTTHMTSQRLPPTFLTQVGTHCQFVEHQ